MTMEWFGPLIVVLFVLAVWRRLHHRYASLKFKYKLFELRDRLRRMAIEGEIDCDSWIFSYFDTSFSKAIQSYYWITMFRMFVLAVKHEDDPALERFRTRMEAEVGQNKSLKDLQDEYIEAAKIYMIEQHKVSIYLVKPFVYFIFGAAAVAKRVEENSRGVIVYPETSTSRKYSDVAMAAA